MGDNLIGPMMTAFSVVAFVLVCAMCVCVLAMAAKEVFGIGVPSKPQSAKPSLDELRRKYPELDDSDFAPFLRDREKGRLTVNLSTSNPFTGETSTQTIECPTT
jgi:hypothetical protein